MNLNNNLDIKSTSVHVGQGYFRSASIPVVIRLFLTRPQNSIWRLTRSASNLLVEMIWNGHSRAVLVIKPLTLLLQPYRIETYRMYFFPEHYMNTKAKLYS